MRRCCVRVVFRFFLLAFVLATLSIASIAQLGGGGVNVLTWHNDNYPTGDNLSESVLTSKKPFSAPKISSLLISSLLTIPPIRSAMPE
jgi:hypothetical protein